MTTQLRAVAGDLDILYDEETDRVITWTWKINGLPKDLTGYSAATFTVRDTVSSDNTIISKTLGSGVALGGTLGTIAVTLTDTDTNLGAVEHVYSLVLTDPAGLITATTVGKFVIKARA